MNKRKHDLKVMAEMVRGKGQGGDSVLAHISPAESKFLAKNFGGDINPHTGLPQYGLFKKLGKVVRGALPFAAALAAAPFGPTAMMGAATVTSAATGKGKMKNRLLKGAVQGAGAVAAPWIAQKGVGALGSAKASLFGGVGSGANNGLLGGIFGGGQGGGAGMLGSMLGGGKGGEGGGGFGGLNTLLAGTALAGVLKGKSKYPKYEGPSASQLMQQHGMQAPSRVIEPRRVKKVNVRTHNNPQPNPYLYERKWFEEEEPEYYAHGGHVQPVKHPHHASVEADGILRSKSGGQTDDIEVLMKPRSYVHDATTVSLYGDGDTEAGFNRLLDLKDKFEHAAYNHGYTDDESDDYAPAMVSGGEMVWSPASVYGAGLLVKGDPGEGVKVLDAFRDNLRKQKGVKKFLPPKSKQASYYLR